MASAVELDLDRLLAPIPGGDPAGQPLPFQVKEKLDESRKEVNPENYPEDDPNRPELKRADWPTVIRLCDETLTRTSKDLLTAVRLTEALTKQHAFAGLAPALMLLARMFEDCWERMFPLIEDDDLEPRAGPLNWLDDPGRGGRFPNTLRTTALIGPADKPYSYLDWERARDGTGSASMDVLDKAIAASPRELCQARLDDVLGCLTGLNHLTEVLNSRLGPVAPGMVAVKQALQQCEVLAKQALQRKGPAPATAAAEPAAHDEPAPEANGAPAAAPAKRAVTRQDLYDQLAATAAQLQAMEPHSPIPILVQRAVELGALPFAELMGALVKDHLMAALLREPGVHEQITEEVGKRLASDE